jgi:hypothetical protein
MVAGHSGEVGDVSICHPERSKGLPGAQPRDLNAACGNCAVCNSDEVLRCAQDDKSVPVDIAFEEK